MSATSSISSTHSSSNSGNSGNNNSNNNSLSSASNIVILENQILDSNDVVAAAGLQQLSSAGAGGLKLTRDCAVQYSNLISSYTASSNSSGNTHSNTTIVRGNSPQMNTVNIIQGDATQTNSRVQVLSNVQLVSSKGASQPSTFSYVDASGKNFNVLTSSGKLSANKLISVPITKVKTFNHIGQQQHQQQQHLPSQQTQIVSSQMAHQSQGQSHGASVQKVTVPRNIQLVTRIPNSTISVSNGRVSQITPTLSSSPQQQQQGPQFTIQQYPDSTGSIQPSLEIRSSASGPIINNTSNIGKVVSTKSKNSASLKVMQNSPIPLPNTTTTTKSVGKGMSVNLKSLRNNSKSTASGVNSQYFIKNTSNGTISQTGTTTSIYTTSPAQAVYHNPTPHPPQHPMQIPINTTTGKSRGVYKTSKNQLIQIQQQQQQHQQHQQPHQSPQRSLTPSSSPLGGTMSSNVTYGVTGATTIVQGNVNNRYQNYNSYPIPASQSQSSSTTSSVNSNFKQFNHHLYQSATSTASVTYDSSGTMTMSGGGGGGGGSGVVGVGGHHEHPIPSVTVTGYSSSTGKNKKYAPVVQNESNNTFVLSPVKTKGTGRGRNNSTSNYQPIEGIPYQRYSSSPSRPHQQQQFQTATSPLTSGPNQYQQQTTVLGRDDQVFLNGQQMTDESSARILQSLSQRSSETGKYGGLKQHQQQQFTFYGSDNVPQSPTTNMVPGGSSVNSAGIIYDPSDVRFYEDKHDGRRSSSSDVITYADNIPLREGYPSSYSYNHRDDDDHIGVEVRPAPVDTSNGRYHILQAVLQDHTYFASLPDVKLPEPQPQPVSTSPQQSQLLQTSIPTTVSHHQPLPPPLHHHQNQPQPQQQHYQQALSSSQNQHYLQQSPSSQSHQQSTNYKQQTSLPASVAVTVMPPSSTSVNVAIPPSGVSVPLTQGNLGALVSVTGSGAVGGNLTSPVCASTVTTTTPSSIMVGKQQQPQAIIPGSALEYIYQRQSIPPQDDDANSVISTGSRTYNNMDIDLGEETETAPEGEGEDDSVTRCICDLTHDDGYMICCDKCSAWQHVDCMGIDRMNIPDEYNCEMCQPRPVDRTRARTLQMEKRKEQSLLLANNNLQIPVGEAAVTSTNLMGVAAGIPVITTTGGKGANQYTSSKVLPGSKKTKSTGGNAKKKISENAATKKATKKALDALNRVNGKRKELKKPSKKKVKTTEQNAEKMSNMIRTWIDNYERAITNHYSPELRARLQAFGKMQSQNPLLNSERLIPATTSVASLAQKCTTVPHAGGKILISTEEIEPKTPIIEIRGKYMLSSQHKPLQSLFNMAANGKLSNNKNAGPFLFLYQVTQGGMELCVDTRTYGNDARFVRRSCRPNAEILHNVEKGVVHLYVVSTASIKANTEITIKHDEQLIQRVGGVVILTHTTVTKLCACGLIKECQYSSQLSDGLLPTGNATGTIAAATIANSQMVLGGVCSTTTTIPKPSKSKKNNGVLGDGEKKPAKKRNSRSTSSNPETRLRSISSSGDSTSEMMLYVQQQQQQQQQNPGTLQQSPVPQNQPPLSPLQATQPTFQPTPSQLVHQQLQQTAMHFMQQSPPGLMQQSQPVYMYSPPPASQPLAQSPAQLQLPTQMQPPVVQPPTPPPNHHPVQPISPVLNVSHRAAFYTEIKSPMNSPPTLNLTGPPPLVIPALSSSIKPSTQHPPPLQPMSAKSPSLVVPTLVNVPALAIPCVSQPLHDQPRHDFQQQQQQQQHFHQQQIMEEIIKIKIKSPKVSPMKQEYSPSPTPPPPALVTTTSMLSPPPPPPNPIVQRLRCAESLKQELFHSHYQPQMRPPSPLPSPPPPTIQTPVKVEDTPVEPKQEPDATVEEPQSAVVKEEQSPVTVEVKIEEDVKTEPLPEPEPVVKLEDSSPTISIKTEEGDPIKEESPVKEVKEEILLPKDQDSKVVIDTANICDSATSSPVKLQCTLGNTANSTNSSPHSTSSQNHPHSGGSSSSSKKKCNPFKETLTEKKEKLPSRKLTREERKMEAIVKAFEKMEQSQQRKQELKEQRKEGKRRSVSSSTPDEGIPSGGSSTKKKSISSQKRKKKKSKSLSQHFGSPNQNRKKKVSKSSKKSKNARVLTLNQESSKRPHESKTTELLITLSPSVEQPTQSSYFGDDVKPLPETTTPNDNSSEPVATTTAPNIPLLSSACMLVEAAVGPLEHASGGSAIEQDFKFPQKAKTKKSMSREWLSGQAADAYRRNTPDQDSGYISEDKSQDYRRTPFEESSLTPLGVDVSDPSICIVAKKVEEFIAQNSPLPDEVAAAYKWDEKVTTSLITASNSQDHPQAPTNPGNVSESAAAKKRWLRQAISEETDELTQASSSPPPPNGFTTPLKKRRVIRQSDETQSQQQTTVLSAQNIDFTEHSTPAHNSQSLLINSQQTYGESGMQWQNSGPPPLSYPFGISEDKQAMDLSRTAVTPLLMVQQQRIQPYKIVPIAQALTPLHFTDPEPLPTQPVPPVLIPQSASTQSQANRLLMSQDSREIIQQASSAQQLASATLVDYESFSSPPPSAVAAMVPASLLPPELPLVIVPEPSPLLQQQPQQQQQHARMDVSYPSPAPVPGITRSKGSQKYIGSPAKFEPPSPSESLSSGVAETPEKNSVTSCYSSESVVNSDVEEDATAQEQAASVGGLNPEMHSPAEDASIEEPVCSTDDAAKEKDAKEKNCFITTDSSKKVVSAENNNLLLLEPVLEKEPEIVDQEEVMISDVDAKTKEGSMEVSQTLDSKSELSYSQVEVIPEVPQKDIALHSPSPVEKVDGVGLCAKKVENAQSTNGREKNPLEAPEEDHEKNELEDLQKVIASFHSENIMNLISRNKKSKKIVNRQNRADEKYRYSRKPARSRSNTSSKEGSITPTAPLSPQFEEKEAPESFGTVMMEAQTLCEPISPEPVTSPETVPVLEPVAAPEPVPAPEPVHVPELVPSSTDEMSISTLVRTYSHPSWHATDSFRDNAELRSYSILRPDIPQINYNSPSTYQSKAARELLSSLSAGSEPLSSFTSYRSSTSFLDYPKSSIGGSTSLTSNTSSSTFQYRSSNEINTLLEKGFSSSRSSSFSTLGSDRSTDRVGSSYLLSSTKVTDNLSTLGSAGSTYPKIFTKTASSDPRLNPALTTPEPPAAITPKRKLSINEYRQRKMQSCSTSTSATVALISSAITSPDAPCRISTASNCSNSSSSDSGGSNQISSSLGSNDVSSSICKELELELELGDEKSSMMEDSSSFSSETVSKMTMTIASTSEPSSTEGTV